MYSSSKTCAFAPPKPKELTPINNGFFDFFSGVKRVTTCSLAALKSMFLLGVSKCNDFGNARFLRLIMTLKIPAIPDAVSK